MRPIPKTYFVTANIAGRRTLLQNDAHAALLTRLTFEYRDEGRYFLHAVVVMPDHLHALITPSYNHTLDRCVACIKGGFAQAIGSPHQAVAAIWRKGFQRELMRHSEDYVRCRSRIAQNPEGWGLRDHRHVHVSGPHLDPMPRYLSI